MTNSQTLQLPIPYRATRRQVVALVVTLGVLLGRTACHAEEIKIETADHKTIQGQLFGNGANALLLCHGRSAKDGAESFKELSENFRRKGIRCLAISFRGYPSETPEDLPHKEFDVVAGFDLLVSKGATHVFVLGSSMGGFAALEALEALQTRKEFAGIILISAHHATACQKSDVPKLMIAAQDDEPTFTKVSEMFNAASLPKQFVSYSIGGHGQQLLQTQGGAIQDKITAFISDFSQPTSSKSADK